MNDRDELEKTAVLIRRDILTMIYRSGDGHPAPSLSAADIITALYFRIMRIDPGNPDWPDRDRFILSKGHACPALYAALARKGYFPTGEYASLRKLHSMLQGHPDMNKTRGVDFTSGSLGNGLSVGFGIAIAGRIRKRDYRTYVLCGDGELGEGAVWEAAQAIPKFRLDSLTLFIDNNGMQSGGHVAEIGGITNIPGKFRAFEWNVLEIDGHSMEAILDASGEAANYKQGPTAIVAHTVKGKGVPFMENDNSWHKRTPTEEEYRLAMHYLGGGPVCEGN